MNKKPIAYPRVLPQSGIDVIRFLPASVRLDVLLQVYLHTSIMVSSALPTSSACFSPRYIACSGVDLEDTCVRLAVALACWPKHVEVFRLRVLLRYLMSTFSSQTSSGLPSSPSIAQLRAGDRVLDLATGTADVAILIAKELTTLEGFGDPGTAAHETGSRPVVGIDPSANMLDVRERVAQRCRDFCITRRISV